METIHQDPHLFELSATRWTPALLLQVSGWLRLRTQAGMHQLLKRLGIHLKQGRSYVHSPDLRYREKVEEIATAIRQVQSDPQRYVLLYLDEMGFQRQPTLARSYERSGHVQPLARYGHGPNTVSRILGAMDRTTGKVFYRQRSHITVACLANFWSEIRDAYPQAEVIYIVVDNWPVHFHADVLASLETQRSPFAPYRPANWPTTPKPSAVHANLPIQLLPLPTYAPWLNPIEKLWRLLKQQVLHLHRLAEEWPLLKQRVNEFLDRFALDSPELLRYVGLLPN